jgi:5-formyltetrahydrofolate cyclo-ligase
LIAINNNLFGNVKTLIPKSEARKLVVQRRTELTSVDISQKTERIIQRLSTLDEFVHAQTVHCYIASRPGEVDTKKLINYMEGWGKVIVIPKLNKRTKTFNRFNFMGWEYLVKNNEGYLEPHVGIDEDMSDIDLVIVPALAISVSGQRVGYGGGYYDKLLKKTFAPKIVLAYEFQIFDYIESHFHDARVDKIVTEIRTINTRESSRKFDS